MAIRGRTYPLTNRSRADCRSHPVFIQKPVARASVSTTMACSRTAPMADS